MLLLVLAATLRLADPGPPWQPLVDRDGVSVSFLFYGRTYLDRNGVVLYITNHSARAVWLSFTLVMRADGRERFGYVETTLRAGERQTGSEHDLVWMPFGDECGPSGTQPCSIGELGVRGWRVATEGGERSD